GNGVALRRIRDHEQVLHATAAQFVRRLHGCAAGTEGRQVHPETGADLAAGLAHPGTDTQLRQPPCGQLRLLDGLERPDREALPRGRGLDDGRDLLLRRIPRQLLLASTGRGRFVEQQQALRDRRRPPARQVLVACMPPGPGQQPQVGQQEQHEYHSHPASPDTASKPSSTSCGRVSKSPCSNGRRRSASPPVMMNRVSAPSAARSSPATCCTKATAAYSVPPLTAERVSRASSPTSPSSSRGIPAVAENSACRIRPIPGMIRPPRCPPVAVTASTVMA